MSPTPSNRYTAAVSTWLLVEGVWGFFSPVVLAFLTTNPFHATIHVLLGLTGLWRALSDRTLGFLWLLGALLITVGALYFLPGGRIVTDLLRINQAGAIINIVLGGGALVCAAFGGRAARAAMARTKRSSASRPTR